VMAGMDVVVVGCDTEGNVDLIDLKSKIMEHHNNLAALMITYPSTHGVFEEAITDICAMVHDAGGQVYVDGANLNALVGLAQPGKFGADVSHLNLHKTFCIPHGGGGPGVGPVGVRAHLAPYLPNHPLDSEAGPLTGPGPISAAPFGSASILPIPWMYIRMMGAKGLTEATSIAILSANYIASELSNDYPVLYSGKSGRIAHECILDIRPLTKESGVTVDDIAKRLMDFGFHAPTMSFPVAGTLMIEPTESEDLFEIERFIRAMRIIKREAESVLRGEISIEDSPLRHAPHTVASLVGDWDRKYSRQVAAFPDQVADGGGEMVFGGRGKYWPTVGRIDGAFGDRNLVCSCPSIESYAGGSDA
ncbi:MAG: glycine dehydrogenase (aminomethyl-transferring), partial [Actinobacteria bacterium]|nr:glycine dehydrogenase (aminomethyl-transferring) [Actinomycetota bacterium]